MHYVQHSSRSAIKSVARNAASLDQAITMNEAGQRTGERAGRFQTRRSRGAGLAHLKSSTSVRGQGRVLLDRFAACKRRNSPDHGGGHG
jgi:hypothetical protein